MTGDYVGIYVTLDLCWLKLNWDNWYEVNRPVATLV